jgi:hypothetical protein
MMKNEPNEILERLDAFTRKYYKNRLIRGSLWAMGLLSLLFLLLVVPESVFYFPATVRTVLFFASVALILFVLVRLIVIPVLQLFRIGKIITQDQAADIIGKHFPEISDKLLNTLQLIRADVPEGESRELLVAGINQKTEKLKLFPFTKAVDFRNNLKYLRYVLVPVFIIVILSVLTPGTISDPAKRLVTFNTNYTKPLPYELQILNRNFTALQQQDFELQVKLKGEEIPSEILVKQGDILTRMKKGKGFIYSYLFKSLQSDVSFTVIAGDYSTNQFTIRVLPKPIILNFDVVMEYPGYTGKRKESIENQGDLVIPEGTRVQWNFFTKDVGSLDFTSKPDVAVTNEKSGNRFSYNMVGKANFSYRIIPSNGYITASDSLAYNVVVVKDGYPSIFVAEAVDSVTGSRIFYKGTLKDDYGFSKLTFNYTVRKSDDRGEPQFMAEEIPVEHRMNNQVFYFAIDQADYIKDPGYTLDYFFEIWDNDGINGPKSAKTETRTVITPTTEEIAKNTADNVEKNEEEIRESIKNSRSMSKTVDDLNRKMVDQEKVTWQEKKKLEDFIKSAEDIQKKIEDAQKRNNQNIQNEERFLETSERIMEKQKQLNEMMDQLFPEELKKMIEELKSLMNQMDKEKLGNMLDKMKMSSKELEKQLDRNLDLMKQIEFDRKLEETVNEMRKTADEMDKLSEKTEKENSEKSELENRSDELKRKADSLFKKSEELKKEGKELEDPVNLGDPSKSSKEVSKNLDEGKESLKKNQRKKAAESQKKAASEMRNFASDMESANQEAEDSQTEEDAANLRMILENLLRLSFDQEELIGDTRKLTRNDPKLQELVQRQKSFADKMKVIADSLEAIGKRQLEIKPVVTKELNTINSNVEMTLEQYQVKNYTAAVTRQQFIMTSINNLALLLNESLQQMNERMSMSMQSKSGNKSCNNPSAGKKGKKSAKDLKDLQGKIGEQLKKLKEGMEAAKKEGKNGKPDLKGMNKELAKLAAQQEALRNEMQKYQNELGDKGIKNNSGLNDAAKEMEQIEKDLVNKQITQETIRRQQSIMTRLLESEKAEQERDKEDRRESIESKTDFKRNLTGDFKYKENIRGSQDQLKLELPGLQNFYKTKINSYFVTIEK